MNLKTLRRAVLTIALAGFSCTTFAQDLIARQAPVDRRLRAVDSVAIQRAVERDEMAEPSYNIYNSWVTTKAHPYKSSEVPDSFRIDLRGFCMPTPSRLVTSRFGYRPRFRRMHKGLDIKDYTGDTIVAAFDGKVRVARYDAGGYGYYIVLRHNNGLETIYGHLSKQLVTTDENVRAGEPIGLGGNTGGSYGSHLHFETRLAGEPINPEELFDFPAQDVTGDFYTFRKNHNSDAQTPMLASNNTRDKETASTYTKSSHFYKVKRGENLSSIASKLGISEKELTRANRLKSTSKLRIGQILRY